MKILFYRYGSICEPDIIESFETLGHQINEIDVEVFNKDISASESVKLVSQYLLENSMDFVFSINFFPILSEVCNIFKIPYLCWIVDSPVMTLFSHSICNKCNRVFIFDKALYMDFVNFNPDCIFHLPLATNVNHMTETISSADNYLKEKFSSDVSFVGSLYTEKCPYDRLSNTSDYLNGYLAGLIEAQIRVYGYYFIDEILTDEIVDDFKKHLPGFYTFPPNSFKNDKAAVSQLYIGNKISSVERIRILKQLSLKFNVDIYTGSDTSCIPGIHNRGLAKTLTEMPLIFNNSKINLNITCKSIRSGLSLRIFDVLGSMGFLITNYQSELSDCFNINEDLVVYESQEELDDLVAYYLSNPAKCKEIAHNGYENVKNNHSYINRISKMLKIALNK